MQGDLDTEEWSNLQVLYRNEFDRFSPLTGEVSESLFRGKLAEVAARARKCLRARDDEDVITIAQFMDMAVTAMVKAGRLKGCSEDGSDVLPDKEAMSCTSELELARIVCECFMPPGDEVSNLHVMPDDEIGAAQDVLRVNHADVFATCALILVVRAIEFDYEDWMASFGGMYAIEAAEAVMAAEREHALWDMRSRPDGLVQVEIRERNRRAAVARWKKLEPARRRAIELYRSREWPSRAEAVRRMRREVMALASQSGAPLAETNADVTIDGWLKNASKR